MGQAPLQLGPCRLLTKLGEGGFGAVYRAHHLRMARDVAVKVLPPLAGPRARVQLERFRREGLAAARVNHPNVARVLDLGLEPVPYLVQELVEGASLDARVAQRGPLSVLEVVAIGRQLVQGLEAIHAAGLVHRDLKPGNVLLNGEGEAKIVDFGVVSFGQESDPAPSAEATPPALAAAADGRLTVDGAMVGTPWFMAPEQVRSRAGRVGPAADVFALGAVLYFCLSGRPPHLIDESDGVFELVARRISEPPEPIERADLPAEIAALIEDLLAPDPSERPSLEQILERLVRPAPGELAPGVPRRALAAGAVVLLGLAALLAAFSGGGEPALAERSAPAQASAPPTSPEDQPAPSASLDEPLEATPLRRRSPARKPSPPAAPPLVPARTCATWTSRASGRSRVSRATRCRSRLRRRAQGPPSHGSRPRRARAPPRAPRRALPRRPSRSSLP